MRRWVIAILLCSFACSPDKPTDAEAQESTIRIGAVMLENGRRFETAGRAATAGRWELAEYEVHEILELFEADMPRALLPGECDDAIADRTFEVLSSTELPRLRDAAHARDAEAFNAAWRTAASNCNGCHAACQASFIEVPTEPGNAVPRLDSM